MKHRFRRAGGAIVTALLFATVLAGPAHGRVKVVDVLGDTSFHLAPDRGYEQYYGHVAFRKVEVTKPRGEHASRKIVRKARAACLNTFATGRGAGYTPAVEIALRRAGLRIELNWHFPSTVEDYFSVNRSGDWISRAFNGTSGEPVYAEGGFWTRLSSGQLGRRVSSEATVFQHKGKGIVAECDGKFDAKRIYP